MAYNSNEIRQSLGPFVKPSTSHVSPLIHGTVCLFIPQFVYSSLSVSIHRSVCLFIPLFVYSSLSLSVHRSVCLFIAQFVYFFLVLFLFIFQFVFVCAQLYVHLSISLSVPSLVCPHIHQYCDIPPFCTPFLSALLCYGIGIIFVYISFCPIE